MSSYSIASHFDEYFRIKFADSVSLRQEAYKIRYGVYSDELGWEPENPTQMETDPCDHYSYHCLLEHRRTNVFAGCIRLIIPPPAFPQTPLPFEENCLESARKEVKDSTLLPRGSFGEISRLAVLSNFRRREKEKKVPYVLNETNPNTVFSEEEQRNFPNIAIGLYLAGVALADIFNHCGIFVMMEPRLNRRLLRLGLPFVQAGDEMDYHGLRAIFYLDRNAFQHELSLELSELYQIIYNDLSHQIRLTPYLDLSDK